MNLLSHHFLDSKPEKPYYNVGLVLPDLLGMMARGQRYRTATTGDSEWEEDVLQGVRRHLHVDKVFHCLPEFVEGAKYLRRKMDAAGLAGEGRRLFFAAHILYELLLDRWILKHFPQAPDQFYADLDALDKPSFGGFIAQHFDIAAGDFLAFLERFQTHRYIYHYSNNEQLLFALNRIMQRAGQRPFTDESAPAFLSGLPAWEEELAPEFERIFDVLRVE